MFFSLDVTGEDAAKTEMYRMETKRKAERRSVGSIGEYLSRLGMRMDAHLLRDDEVTRAVQLAGKTNQFNTTTIRYTREEVEALMRGENSDVLAVHMADKYGDQGLVALVVLVYRGVIATVESFLMSCRVMGRQAEVEIMALVRDLVEVRGAKTVHASYRRTAKNAPVADLFDRLGFVRTGDSDDESSYEADVMALPKATGYFSHESEGIA